MYTRLCFVLLLFLISVDSARRNLKKESNLKITKGLRSRGEIMDNLFVIYDPSFLAIVWPKITNGVHLSIDSRCWDDMSVFLRDLTEGRAWAYRTADASGRYPSSLFGGNHFWLGSKQQCLGLDNQFLSTMSNDTWGVGFYSRDYLSTVLQRERDLDERMREWQSLVERDELLQHVVAADNAPPFHVAYTVLQIELNITKLTLSESFDVTLGTCLPRSCNPEDVISIVNFSIMLNDNLKSNTSTARTIRIRSLRQVEAQYDLKNDLGAVLTILITILLIVLAIIATIVDYDWIKFRPYPVKSITFDLQKYNNTIVENDKKFMDEFKRQQVSDVLNESKGFGKKGFELDALPMNNLNNSCNVHVKKLDAVPPSITLDVVNAEGAPGSCTRCGKYKKQCSNPKRSDNLGPCPRVKYNSCASLTTEYKFRNNLFKNLLLSFSLRHSWKRIFNTTMANKDLSVIHMLRIFATLWIIFVHVAVLTNYLSENGGKVSEYNNVYYIITTGTIAFDILFFVSGLFSAHHFFYLKSHYTVEELVNCGGMCGQVLQLVCFITNRAIRLLPPYVYTIFVSAVLARVWRDTAALALPERDYSACDAHWWRNVLYITNLYPKDQECIQISWYLSTETQMHVLGAGLCLLLATARQRTALALIAALFLASTAFDVTAAFTDYNQRLTGVFDAYATIINRPLSKVPAYFIGVVAGWLIHRFEGKRLKLSKMCSMCIWSVSLAVTAVAGAAPWLRGGAALLAALPAAPVALLWPAVLLCTQYSHVTRRWLASPAAAALSRLAYCALLLHGGAARALLLAADTPLCGYSACLFTYFAGTTLLTILAALCLSLLVEMPCCCLLRRISDCAYS
ncbi:uncharacterized protein [Epargyreus clarus]|uniref:uncharacterized protein n=1 Tax=Epargyreus clarus TaxID=520877 RepID=UPI003C2CA86D